MFVLSPSIQNEFRKPRRNNESPCRTCCRGNEDKSQGFTLILVCSTGSRHTRQKRMNVSETVWIIVTHSSGWKNFERFSERGGEANRCTVVGRACCQSQTDQSSQDQSPNLSAFTTLKRFIEAKVVDYTKCHCLKKLKFYLISDLIPSLPYCEMLASHWDGDKSPSGSQEIFSNQCYGRTLPGPQSISFPSHKSAVCQGYTHTLTHSLIHSAGLPWTAGDVKHLHITSITLTYKLISAGFRQGEVEMFSQIQRFKASPCSARLRNLRPPRPALSGEASAVSGAV